MKKFLLSFFFGLLIINASSTPYEAEHDYQSIVGERLKDNTYLGSEYYKPIIGGLYKKGNIIGSVFYVDETNNVMLILCVTPNRVIRHNQPSTFDNIKTYYTANGWKLLNKEVCKYLIANTPLMIYNRTWVNNNDFLFPFSSNILMETDDDAFYANVYTSNYDKPYDTTWKWMWVTNEYGKRVKENLEFTDTGWKEVPLEPEYVTHYIGK